MSVVSSITIAVVNRQFAAFAHVSYRWYFASMSASMAAMNVQQFITGYMVFELTGSFSLLGAFALAGGAPMLVFSPIGGVMADRIREKKHLVVACQLLNATNVAVVAVLIVTDTVVVGHLLTSALVQVSSTKRARYICRTAPLVCAMPIAREVVSTTNREH